MVKSSTSLSLSFSSKISREAFVTYWVREGLPNAARAKRRREEVIVGFVGREREDYRHPSTRWDVAWPWVSVVLGMAMAARPCVYCLYSVSTTTTTAVDVDVLPEQFSSFQSWVFGWLHECGVVWNQMRKGDISQTERSEGGRRTRVRREWRGCLQCNFFNSTLAQQTERLYLNV